jgi:hypothetical protein
MIAQNLKGKIDGVFHDSLQAFARRTGVTKTTDAIKALIMTTPEYKALSQLNIHETTKPSVSEKNHIKEEAACQGNS